MKKIFTLICAVAIGVTAMAQRQIQNGGFEEWENEGTTSVEPAHWNSFMTGSGNMKSFAAAQQVKKSDDAHSGSASVQIYARSIFGIVAQGNLTTGCINMGSTNATDANGNYNYTNESDEAFHQKFTGLPDAMRIWVKGSCAYPAGASCNLHTTGYFQDPEGNTITATRIAKANTGEINCTDSWQEVIIPFQYDVVDGTRPAYALVTLTTSGTPGQGNASDYMLADDVEFLYYSELSSITFNGKEITIEGNNISIDGTYNATLLELKSNGQGATINTYYNESSKALTVTVKGDDITTNPSNSHTYTLVFSGKENEEPITPQPQPEEDEKEETASTFGSIVPYGDFETWKSECGTTHQIATGGGEYIRPGIEPEGWNGSSINMNVPLLGSNFREAILVEKTADAQQTGSAVKLSNNSISYWNNTITFPAFITYGNLWAWSGGTNFKNSDMSAYGGIAYTKRPDAIRGQYKRTATTEENAHIIAYLWKGTIQGNIGAWGSPSTPIDDLDRAIMGHAEKVGGDGELIASCDHTFTSTADNGWETITVPLDYVEGQESTIPEKMNIIISSGDYWAHDTSVNGNSLEVDSLEFLFYSDLASATYNGEPIAFNDENYAIIDADYDKNLLNLTANGRSARIVKSYNEETRILTILVKGGDYDTNTKNSHTYKVEFLEQHNVISEKTYKDLIQITINETAGEPKEASITIQQWNTGEKSLVLPNFVMGEGYNVGTIIVTPIDIQDDGTFSAKQNITILPGDTPADAAWIGPLLGEVPIDMEGKLTEDSLHVQIQIDLMSRMNQLINVVFGESLIAKQQGGDEPEPEDPEQGTGTIELKGTHNYTDDLVVTLNGVATAPQKTDIIVTFNNNTLDLALKNFTLKDGESDMYYVGNIELKNVKFSLKKGSAYAEFSKNETITIAAGDTPEDAFWMGPMLGDIPVRIAGKVGTDKLYCTIDIEMANVGTIHVDFGTDANWPEVEGGGEDEPEENPTLRDFVYRDLLSVSVNGITSEPDENDVEMKYNEDEGTVTLIIHNFKLLIKDEDGGEELAPIGDIEISGIQPVEVPGKGYYQFMAEQTIQIKTGDDSEKAWIGPYLGDVPLEISGKIAPYKLYCNINIYMSQLGANGQNIRVIFGESFTDCISQTKVQTAVNNSIFTINGMRIDKITKPGLYIINGKKTFIR